MYLFGRHVLIQPFLHLGQDIMQAAEVLLKCSLVALLTFRLSALTNELIRPPKHISVCFCEKCHKYTFRKTGALDG